MYTYIYNHMYVYILVKTNTCLKPCVCKYLNIHVYVFALSSVNVQARTYLYTCVQPKLHQSPKNNKYTHIFAYTRT